MQEPHIDLTFILIYLSPFLLLLPSKWVNKQFRKQRVSIKVVDVVTPVLILMNHVFSMLITGSSYLSYLFIAAAVIGILLTSYFTFKLKRLSMIKCLRVWWRYVFICALILHIYLGIIMLL